MSAARSLPTRRPLARVRARPAVPPLPLALLRTGLAAGAGALLLALAAADAGAQRRDDRDPWRWSGTLDRGAAVRVSSMKGEVRVEPASGSTIEVVARPRDDARRREPLRLDVVEHQGGVTICVLVPDRRCEEQGMEEGRGRRWNDDGDYAATDLVVRLPRGASLTVGTGNGAVSVEGTDGDVRAASGNGAVTLRDVTGDVRASTGNGAVVVEGVRGEVQASSGNGRITVGTTGGPVRASTGNGDIAVRMGTLRDASELRFSTGNGRIVVQVPGSYAGEVDMHTGRGDAVTDFPVRITGRMQPNRIRGTVGDGRGPSIRLSSGNGDVELRSTGGARESERLR